MDASALTTKLERALLDLGDTPDTVAAYLEAQGVHGFRFLPGLCPVAVYLTRTFRPDAVSVGSITCSMHTERAYSRITMPDPVSHFVGRFDGGKYPALERKP